MNITLIQINVILNSNVSTFRSIYLLTFHFLIVNNRNVFFQSISLPCLSFLFENIDVCIEVNLFTRAVVLIVVGLLEARHDVLPHLHSLLVNTPVMIYSIVEHGRHAHFLHTSPRIFASL